MDVRLIPTLERDVTVNELGFVWSASISRPSASTIRQVLQSCYAAEGPSSRQRPTGNASNGLRRPRASELLTPVSRLVPAQDRAQRPSFTQAGGSALGLYLPDLCLQVR